MGFECVSGVFEQKKRENHASLCYSVAPPQGLEPWTL